MITCLIFEYREIDSSMESALSMHAKFHQNRSRDSGVIGPKPQTERHATFFIIIIFPKLINVLLAQQNIKTIEIIDF